MNFSDWPLLTFGDYADLYWEETRSASLRWEEGKLERFTSNLECGAGLRYTWSAKKNRYASADNPNAFRN